MAVHWGTECEIASLGARRPALEPHLVDAAAAVNRSVAELRTALRRMPWSAGYITNMFETEFSAHTGGRSVAGMVRPIALAVLRLM
jgi:hypothetical protein